MKALTIILMILANLLITSCIEDNMEINDSVNIKSLNKVNKKNNSPCIGWDCQRIQ